MKKNSLNKSIFVSPFRFLKNGGGGVQWCTREYLDTIKKADLCPEVISYDVPRDLATRFYRKFFPYPYRGLHSLGLVQKIILTAQKIGSDLIFLNNNDAASLAPALRRQSPSLRLIYLSHGVEITDVVNNLRISPDVLDSSQRKSKWIGDLLKVELKIREALNGVVCISEEDVAFEQWFGARKSLFLPRQIHPQPLNLSPIQGRIGTVSTLDHGPNLHGIRLLAEELSKSQQVELRLVGGPESIGQSLQNEYSCIKYLGRLSNEELHNEASTWFAFVNPIFCHARGASTKVATALGWGMPLLTSEIGARGYRWNKKMIPLASTPSELGAMCIQALDKAVYERWTRGAFQLAKTAPDFSEMAEILLDFLKR